MDQPDDTVRPVPLSQFLTETDSAEIGSWLRGTGRSLTIDEPLVAGKTGATVLRAVLHERDANDHKVILKLIPGDEDLKEPSRHEDAAASFSSEFVAKHMVEQLVASFVLSSGTTVMVQGLAGGSVDNYTSLGALTGTADFRRGARATLEALSMEAARTFSAVRLPLASVMGQQLRTKLSLDGSLRSWLLNEIGGDATSATHLKFRDDPAGTEWMNPVQFADPGSPLASEELTVMSGPTHGDLHSDNIIVRLGRNPNFDDFRLIDFSYFERSYSLAIDPVTLVLAELRTRLPRLSFADRRVLVTELGVDQPGSPRRPEVEDLIRLERESYEHGLVKARQAGFEDDWALQWDVALSAGCLVWASRPSVAFDDRVWFLESAARAATRAAPASAGAGATSRRTLAVGEPFDVRRQEALELVDTIVSQNERFDGSAVTVAVIPATTSLSLEAQVSIASAGWDIVLGFDPHADSIGAPSAAKERGAAVRILRPSQDLEFARGSTVWIAGDGLDGTGYRAEKTLMEWRLENLVGLSRMLQEVTKSTTGPIVVTSFGSLDKKSQLVLDKLLDYAGPLARLVAIHGDEESGISEYDPLDLVGDVELVAESLPPRLLAGVAGGDRVFLPGPPGSPPVELDIQSQTWFQIPGGELVHSGVALESRAVQGVATDFFHGRTISWLELEAGVDIPREVVFAKLRGDVEALLEERGTRRIRFRHTAGAGGTTVARRLAWDLHERFPTLVFSRLLAVDDVIARFERLSFLTETRVLIILDGVPETLSNLVYERLRADSASAVLVLVERHVGGATAEPADLAAMTPSESQLFERIFRSLAPGRHIELQRLATRPDGSQIPFLYALTAFQDDFEGVRNFVGRSLEGADEATRMVLATLAVVQKYAAESVPSTIFARLLELPGNAKVRLGASIRKRAAGLLIEEQPGEWRTLHNVLAKEIIRQIFGSSDGDVDPTMSLSTWAQDFVEMVDAAYPDPLPESAHQLLLKLFVLRENRDESAYGIRQRFSELISDLPFNARFVVMRTLAETFDKDPHFWAHYARLLAYEGGDFGEAYKKIDTALSLSREDPTIWHIRGVIGRKKVSELISSSRVGVESAYELESAVREAAEGTLSDLVTAASFNDDSRYPQIDTIFLAITVIEWARRFKEFESHQALLSSADGAFYSSLLDSAEDALDELDNLLPEDPGYQIAEDASIKLHAIYDDYRSVIEGWKRKISRSDGNVRLMRSRLARAYIQRAGSYGKLDFATTKEIAELMEQNLKERPGDIRSIREWLRTARRTGGHLDRAAEYVSEWVDTDPTRDARYYDYIVSALLVWQGRRAAKPDFERKVELSKSRSQSYSRRRVIYEWLGKGTELAALVHHSDVADWDRRSERSVEPQELRRVRGVIDSIKDAKSGYLLTEGGLRVFFQPGGRFVRGLNEGDEVTALIGFTYDGPEGWRVRLA